MVETLRDTLLTAMWAIIHLEHGLALNNCPITDPDQLRELLVAKEAINKALDTSGEQLQLLGWNAQSRAEE